MPFRSMTECGWACVMLKQPSVTFRYSANGKTSINLSLWKLCRLRIVWQVFSASVLVHAGALVICLCYHDESNKTSEESCLEKFHQYQMFSVASSSKVPVLIYRILGHFMTQWMRRKFSWRKHHIHKLTRVAINETKEADRANTASCHDSSIRINIIFNPQHCRGIVLTAFGKRAAIIRIQMCVVLKGKRRIT